MVDLKAIYLTTLARCAPDRLVQRVVTPDMPRNVVAIGKCSGALLDGVANAIDVERAFAAVPEGYPLPRTRAEIAIGGHPQMTRASFEAGRALLRFVDACGDILFLISGGGSACVEVPRPPHTEEELIEMNARLIASGKPIAEINAARKELSAIKGGRLAERVRGKYASLIYSDVSSGRIADVASGPTDGGILIADNATLVRTAAELVADAVVVDEQIESDVADAARFLADRARQLKPGQILVAGGEPTVVVRGDGRGGRCSELALRVLLELPGWDGQALFAGSDGVDGNSGSAGVLLQTFPDNLDRAQAAAALERSDSWPIVAQVGEPIMIAATGNNLRDLFLMARG